MGRYTTYVMCVKLKAWNKLVVPYVVPIPIHVIPLISNNLFEHKGKMPTAPCLYRVNFLKSCYGL